MFKNNPKLWFFTITFMALVMIIATTYAYDKTYTVYMAGNGHIDTAWQWTTSTSRYTYVPGCGCRLCLH
jgi:hypothetical protein